MDCSKKEFILTDALGDAEMGREAPLQWKRESPACLLLHDADPIGLCIGEVYSIADVALCSIQPKHPIVQTCEHAEPINTDAAPNGSPAMILHHELLSFCCVMDCQSSRMLVEEQFSGDASGDSSARKRCGAVR